MSGPGGDLAGRGACSVNFLEIETNKDRKPLFQRN